MIEVRVPEVRQNWLSRRALRGVCRPWLPGGTTRPISGSLADLTRSMRSAISSSGRLSTTTGMALHLHCLQNAPHESAHGLVNILVERHRVPGQSHRGDVLAADQQPGGVVDTADV